MLIWGIRCSTPLHVKKKTKTKQNKNKQTNEQTYHSAIGTISSSGWLPTTWSMKSILPGGLQGKIANCHIYLRNLKVTPPKKNKTKQNKNKNKSLRDTNWTACVFNFKHQWNLLLNVVFLFFLFLPKIWHNLPQMTWNFACFAGTVIFSTLENPYGLGSKNGWY